MLGKKTDEPAFSVPPPLSVSEQVGGQVVGEEIHRSMAYDNVNPPMLLDEAWMKYIIEFHLPKELEQLIILYLKPLIDLAPKSNIMRREVTMHLIQYDLIWDSYFIYMKNGKYDPKLLVVKEILREAIELQLNRSIGGWLGRLMHTRIFRVSTSDNQGRGEKAGRFLSGRNKGNNNQEL